MDPITLGLGVAIVAGLAWWKKRNANAQAASAANASAAAAADKAAGTDAALRRDAENAQAVLALSLTTAAGIITAADAIAAPFVAPAAGAVQLSFSKLSTQDKANIWRGRA